MLLTTSTEVWMSTCCWVLTFLRVKVIELFLIILEEEFQIRRSLFVWLRNYKNIIWVFSSWIFLQLVTKSFNPYCQYYSGGFLYQCGWPPVLRPRLSSPYFCSVWPLSLSHFCLPTSLLHAVFCYNYKLLPKYYTQLLYAVMSKFYSFYFLFNFLPA